MIDLTYVVIACKYHLQATYSHGDIWTQKVSAKFGKIDPLKNAANLKSMILGQNWKFQSANQNVGGSFVAMGRMDVLWHARGLFT